MLTISNPELRGVASGESIVAFVARGTLTEGDEVELAGAGPRAAADLKPAYRRWAAVEPPEGYSAVVVGVAPTAMLDTAAGAARHILAIPGGGDLVLLRVFGPDGPVVSNDAFAARRAAVASALRT